jgi:hypothetical protein
MPPIFYLILTTNEKAPAYMVSVEQIHKFIMLVICRDRIS